MNRNALFLAFDGVDDDILERSEANTCGSEKKIGWLKWGTMAACLCVVLLGAWAALRTGTSGNPVLTWNSGFESEDYFKYNKSNPGSVSSSGDMNLELPYAESRVFSDLRGDLEAEGIIPVVETHPLFDCSAHYNEDGSLYSLELRWHLRGDSYSDLAIIAGYQEVPQITDCVCIEIDENGNILEPSVTVTERDGVQIVAEGWKNRSKTMTFQNDTGWYQITGSWNDSFESMVTLLDWLWEHPIDFDRFPMDAGDRYDYVYENGEFANIPGVFVTHTPDFAALGYETEAQWLTLKNDEPVYFEGSYCSASVPSLSWSVNAEPEYYDRERVVGELGALTYELVAEVRSQGQNIYFTWDGYVVAVYISDVGTVEDLWQIIKSVQE